MTDKKLIKQELERRISNLEQLGDRKYIEIHFPEQFKFIEVYEGLIKFIDSLSEEPVFPNEINIIEKVFGIGNLESWEYEEAKKLVLLAKEELLKDLEKNKESASEDLEEELHSWMRENCDNNGFFNQLELAHHFAEWQKRQMLKDAVECTWGSRATSSFMSDFPNIECGDKVRIIIVKLKEKEEK